jgi:two-component system, cell cycle response regulator DivK
MSQRILVVEDQEDNRQILRDLLTSADFEVIEAVDGEAGLAAAAAHRPDLILMDIQLPGMDGYEATRRLKADAVLHSVPIIVRGRREGACGGLRRLYFQALQPASVAGEGP